MVITEDSFRAEGHTFKCTRWDSPEEILRDVGRALEGLGTGFEDNPYNFDGDPKFKITIIVEKV